MFEQSKMIYRMNRDKQRELIERAVVKSGSERKMAQMTGIPKGSIYALKFHHRNLAAKHAAKICSFLDMNLKDLDYEELLPDNWGQRKGGMILVRQKKCNGTFSETVERLRRASSQRMKTWHANMKASNPEEYHRWQYERFKCVGGGYKHHLKNGITIRNRLEQYVGDFLFTKYRNVKYEPYLMIGGRSYFPDFVYRNVIVEVTEWKHPSAAKLKALHMKYSDYLQAGYSACFFIPKTYTKFYKQKLSSIVTTLQELEELIKASVA